MGIINRLFGKKELEEKSVSGGGAYPLPVTGGSIPTEWSWNWWQQGKNPMNSGEAPVVHACVDAYAQTIAALPGGHYRYDTENGGKTIVTTSALSRIMRNPNSYQTRSDFMYNLIKQLLYTGNAYAVAYRNDRNEVESLHIVESRSTQPYIDPESKSVYYGCGDNVLAGDLSMMIPARDVLHIKLYTPRHPLVGVSPIENLGNAIAANNAITGHQATFFSQMSRPSGVITTDQVLTKDQLTSLRAAWANQSQGMNSGQIPILHAGMEFKTMALSSQDAQMIQAFQMTTEEIARAFRVPLPLIGDQRHSTYNNVEQLTSAWLAMGLGFVLEHIELSFDKFFGMGPNDFTEFDADSLLRTDFAGRIDALSKGIQGGLYSPNEARAKEGLPSVKFGEEPRVQAQVVPLSQVEASKASAESAPVSKPSKEELDPEEAKIIAYHTIKKALTR